ncbi:MAG: sn-glycerol-1-phosphate dehydrogenase [Clostridia bacterium]|nr:sn-glycerol-1-phosphate dehydrogenase [Clostridia bacterium]
MTRDLTAGITGCVCGQDHACPIRFLRVGANALSALTEVCADYHRVLLVSDDNTDAVCGDKVRQLLGDKLGVSLVLHAEGVVVPDEACLERIEAALEAETDLILGIGSGVINDLCKDVSFRHGLPYGIVATAPSMDGYASVGAALILGGMKVTRNARPPMAIVADTAVLKTAPREMLQAGYGDIIGKYSCLNDWKLSTAIYGEYFCPVVYDLTMDTVHAVEPLAERILAREEEAIGTLMQALVTVGIAMSYVGNSRPASGSEHHLSHFFEITGILENKPYFPHGVDVLYSAVVTARLREELLQVTPQRRAFDRAGWEREIRRIYSTSADGIMALQDKLGWYERDDEAQIVPRWSELCTILREAPTEQQMLALVDKIGLKYEEFTDLYGEEKLTDAVQYAKDLKDRYTVLWLYHQYV